MDEIIAERDLYCKKPNGEGYPIKLLIGKPYIINDVQWACPVEAVGFEERLKETYGIDSFQALIIAFKTLHQILGYFVEDGGKLLYTDRKTEVNLNDIFPAGI
jgi:hypothetical protein